MVNVKRMVPKTFPISKFGYLAKMFITRHNQGLDERKLLVIFGYFLRYPSDLLLARLYRRSV